MLEQANGYFEPSMTHVFLPRCKGCGAAHPRASKIDSRTCLECGEPVPEPGRAVTVPAALTGFAPSTLAARFFLWAGKRLALLAKGL